MMSKPRIGTMIGRGAGRWRLQVAVDPDPVSGERRRLSRTVHGTRSEAKDALQRMVVDAGGGLYGGWSRHRWGSAGPVPGLGDARAHNPSRLGERHGTPSEAGRGRDAALEAHLEGLRPALCPHEVRRARSVAGQ